MTPPNYPFWQKTFRNASDDELDQLHEKFYKEIGLKINPITVYDPTTKKTLPPNLLIKDLLVKKLILEKDDMKTLLNVAFWRGYFAFNMGFEGFHVDGVECYKRAVELAKQTQNTLPPELASRFNFRYGVAENLDGYPKYDITVNHCLEHVRDPKHVMTENLEHLKPNGYAYFTPPLRHGCDSPTHLHHFMEEKDLLNLLPAGFKANIYRVKFQDTSPRVNIFVMEVFHK